MDKELKKKLRIITNQDSNGIVYPSEIIINEEDIEWFKSIPDDEIVVDIKEDMGSPQYHHIYIKSDFDKVTVMGKKRIRGRDEIGSLVKNENNGDYEYKEKITKDMYWNISEKKEISSALGIPYDEIEVDGINGNLYLHNGNPIKCEIKENDETGKPERVFTEVKENPFYEKMLERIGDRYYCKIGNFLVQKENNKFYLAGLYESKEERQEEFDRLLEYLDYDVEEAERIFNAFDRDKTKFDIGYSRKYKKDNNIVEMLYDSNETLDKLILMAESGSLSARSFLEARTFIEEKDELEKLLQSKEILVDAKDEIGALVSDRTTDDINVSLESIKNLKNEGKEKLPEQEEHK